MPMKKSASNRIVFLSGKKVVLRPISETDISKMLKWINDPDVTQYIAVYMPVSENEEKQWVEDLSKKRQTDLVLGIETVKGVHIGNIGIHKISWKDRTAEIGITIGDKNYWGKGYGSEAIFILIKYSFSTLNLRKLSLSVLGNNPRAINCYKKCGFRFEGRLKNQIFKGGKYIDQIIMSVFKKNLNRLPKYENV